jgi:transposase-like protein
MGKRARKRDLDREIRFWELIANGVGTVEACRGVGVARKSGYRWRSEMGGVIAKKSAVSSGRYLSLFERQRIASWHDRGASVRDIARRVGRSSSTVSRELRRNCLDWDDGCEPVLAYLWARERAKRPKTGRIAGSPWLAKTIQTKLALHWSPEQIHLHLKAQHGKEAHCGWGSAEVAVFEPVGVALDGDDLGVVDEAVDHCGGDGVVAEYLAPPSRKWHGFVWSFGSCSSRVLADWSLPHHLPTRSLVVCKVRCWCHPTT